MRNRIIRYSSQRVRRYSRHVNLFFFQAEDGIRDLYVTGVQTCALPILTAAGGFCVPPVLNATADFAGMVSVARPPDTVTPSAHAVITSQYVPSGTPVVNEPLYAPPLLLIATKPALPRPKPMTFDVGDCQFATAAVPTALWNATIPRTAGSRSRQYQPLAQLVSVTYPFEFGGP